MPHVVPGRGLVARSGTAPPPPRSVAILFFDGRAKPSDEPLQIGLGRPMTRRDGYWQDSSQRAFSGCWTRIFFRLRIAHDHTPRSRQTLVGHVGRFGGAGRSHVAPAPARSCRWRNRTPRPRRLPVAGRRNACFGARHHRLQESVLRLLPPLDPAS